MFTCTYTHDRRRIGTLTTPHGSLTTPFFMPDATRATVRGVLPELLEKAGIEALVVNTYHLFLQPGEALVSQAGGIHAFMDWHHPVLSDSGGYQVFSLIHKDKKLGNITEEGAEFTVPETGEKKLLTPEKSIQVQFDLGVDMMVVLDDPRPNDVSFEEMAESVERTLRWARRCKEEFEHQVQKRGLTKETRPLLFGVVQGGKEKELRLRCAEGLVEIGFDGYGFGGRHVDENGELLRDIIEYTASILPEDKPRFALGVGKPEDIAFFYNVGWDMFDCVIPTREGRHGRLFLWKEQSQIFNFQDGVFYQTINIRNTEFRSDLAPVEEGCPCVLCTKYSRAYLRHLLAVSEPLALTLASIHNLSFYARLMQILRKSE